MVTTTLHGITSQEEAKCICGKEDQTMDHILFHCSETSAQRDLLKLQINKKNELAG
jgi:hypothetical protein